MLNNKPELSLADFFGPSPPPDLTDEAAMEASEGTRAIVPDDLCNKNWSPLVEGNDSTSISELAHVSSPSPSSFELALPLILPPPALLPLPPPLPPFWAFSLLVDAFPSIFTKSMSVIELVCACDELDLLFMLLVDVWSLAVRMRVDDEHSSVSRSPLGDSCFSLSFSSSWDDSIMTLLVAISASSISGFAVVVVAVVVVVDSALTSVVDDDVDRRCFSSFFLSDFVSVFGTDLST